MIKSPVSHAEGARSHVFIAPDRTEYDGMYQAPLNLKYVFAPMPVPSKTEAFDEYRECVNKWYLNCVSTFGRSLLPEPVSLFVRRPRVQSETDAQLSEEVNGIVLEGKDFGSEDCFVSKPGVKMATLVKRESPWCGILVPAFPDPELYDSEFEFGVAANNWMNLVQKLHGEQLERLRSPRDIAEVASISEVAAPKSGVQAHAVKSPPVTNQWLWAQRLPQPDCSKIDLHFMRIRRKAATLDECSESDMTKFGFDGEVELWRKLEIVPQTLLKLKLAVYFQWLEMGNEKIPIQYYQSINGMTIEGFKKMLPGFMSVITGNIEVFRNAVMLLAHWKTAKSVRILSIVENWKKMPICVAKIYHALMVIHLIYCTNVLIPGGALKQLYVMIPKVEAILRENQVEFYEWLRSPLDAVSAPVLVSIIRLCVYMEMNAADAFLAGINPTFDLLNDICRTAPDLVPKMEVAFTNDPSFATFLWKLILHIDGSERKLAEPTARLLSTMLTVKPDFLQDEKPIKVGWCQILGSCLIQALAQEENISFALCLCQLLWFARFYIKSHNLSHQAILEWGNSCQVFGLLLIHPLRHASSPTIAIAELHCISLLVKESGFGFFLASKSLNTFFQYLLHDDERLCHACWIVIRRLFVHHTNQLHEFLENASFRKALLESLCSLPSICRPEVSRLWTEINRKCVITSKQKESPAPGYLALWSLLQEAGFDIRGMTRRARRRGVSPSNSSSRLLTKARKDNRNCRSLGDLPPM